MFFAKYLFDCMECDGTVSVSRYITVIAIYCLFAGIALQNGWPNVNVMVFLIIFCTYWPRLMLLVNKTTENQKAIETNWYLIRFICHHHR